MHRPKVKQTELLNLLSHSLSTFLLKSSQTADHMQALFNHFLHNAPHIYFKRKGLVPKETVVLHRWGSETKIWCRSSWGEQSNHLFYYTDTNEIAGFFLWWKLCIQWGHNIYLSCVKISRLSWLLQSKPKGNYKHNNVFHWCLHNTLNFICYMWIMYMFACGYELYLQVFKSIPHLLACETSTSTFEDKVHIHSLFRSHYGIDWMTKGKTCKCQLCHDLL